MNLLEKTNSHLVQILKGRKELARLFEGVNWGDYETSVGVSVSKN